MKKYSRTLFIFRRDLRLEDNTGLIAALDSSEKVIAGFIFDPRQVGSNPYRSDHAVQFMTESLSDLNEQLKEKNSRLYIFYGTADQIVKQLIEQESIEAVFVNRDYTPFSISRDLAIQQTCEKKGISFRSYGDSLLNEPEDITKIGGGIYTVFTPFKRTAMDKPVRKPVPNRLRNYFNKPLKSENKTILGKVLAHPNKNTTVKGGRTEARKIIKSMGRFKDYAQIRNIPGLDATTHLSAHNKFGTCSIREVYDAIVRRFGPDHALVNELYWRDFFTHVGFHFPYILGGAFHKKYHGLSWDNDQKSFEAWCQGKTGFPIVDAGMRELNATGFMHNRVRMITASFLIKDLHIDWRWGEKYFAQKLIDYDPLVNNGNWQWAASTGCDAQPYFRIFNPWLQQEKFDPDCVYIKRWVGELKGVRAKDIHKLSKGQMVFSSGYPLPVVDHKMETEKARAMYERARDLK